ncbi:MAG TPA: hypothetical protein DHV51_03565 [Opitutae bacterium]|nr:hypothetical protein [Opitutae bacterium]
MESKVLREAFPDYQNLDEAGQKKYRDTLLEIFDDNDAFTDQDTLEEAWDVVKDILCEDLWAFLLNEFENPSFNGEQSGEFICDGDGNVFFKPFNLNKTKKKLRVPRETKATENIENAN